jgi:WD40 repeat protein
MSTPVLRIEAGMHSALPRKISVDRAGELLATCSDDGTCRLWSLASGELLHIFRAPLGAGHEGKLFAVALSPDGQLLVFGGFTGPYYGPFGLLCYRISDKQLCWRKDSLPGPARAIRFTPDGQQLIVSCSACRLHLIDPKSGNELARNEAYAQDTYGLAVTQKYIYTCDFGGMVRKYDLKLTPLASVSVGDAPFGLALSPDETKLAVCFETTPTVKVLDADSLQTLYAPDTSGIVYGLQAPCWSHDGSRLYATGSWFNQSRWVRVWEGEGKGHYHDERIASSEAAFSAEPLPEGIVLNGLPWSLLHSSRYPRPPANPLVPFWQRGLLELDNTAETIRFGWQGQDTGTFCVRDPGFVWKTGELKQPIQTGIPITQWKNNYQPHLRKKRIYLENWEACRTLSIAPDKHSFVLGADFSLHCLDKKGNLRWKVSTPGAAWGVNHSDDSGLVVAELGDGTIRWYRNQDGKELLAFYPHAERQMWVLWTPSGFFDCSPGADELIGWHVNRAPDEPPDFFPASRFRERLHHPEVVRRILMVRDEGLLLGELGLSASVSGPMPPVVKLVGVEQRLEGIAITVAIRSPAPVTRIFARSGGRPIPHTVEGDTIILTAYKGAPKVTIFAQTDDTTSSPLEVSLETSYAESTAKRVFRALIVGRGSGLALYGALTARGAQVRDLVGQEEISDGLSWLGKADIGVLAWVGEGSGSARELQLPLGESEVSQGILLDTVRNFPGRLVVLLESGKADISFLIQSIAASEHGGVVLAAQRGLGEALAQAEGELIDSIGNAVVALKKGQATFLRAKTVPPFRFGT